MNELIYKEFLEKQSSIYKKFEDSKDKILSEGLNKHSLAGKGSYLVFFKHDEEVSEAVAYASKYISEIFPSIIYPKKNIHTTISDYNLSLDFHPDENILKKLSMIVKKYSANTSPRILYDGMVANQDTVIFKGTPDIIFLELSESIVNDSKSNSLDLRMPWGAHITCSRINDKISVDDNKDSLDKFLNFIDTNNLAFISRPEKISIGHYVFSQNGENLNMHTFDEYNLKF
jgi:hypothetical protein